MNIALLYVVLTICAFASARPRDRGCRKPMPKVNINVRSDNVFDLTHAFNENTVVWPTNPFGFELVEVFKGFLTSPRYWVSMNTFRQPEHSGTHMDAPIHFSKTGKTIDQVSLDRLIGPGILLNLKEGGERFGRDSLVTIEHFERWERDNRRSIRSGSIVLLYTGYGEFYNNHAEYWGTNKTGPDSVPFFHYPGLHPDAADWLVRRRCIAAVGIDTPSMDRGQSNAFEAHRILTASNVSIFENVAQLDALSATNKDFRVIALPEKIEGGTGGPLRIMAVTV